LSFGNDEGFGVDTTAQDVHGCCGVGAVGLIGVINSVLLQDVVGAQGLAPLPGGTRRAKIAVRGLRDLIVYLIWQYVKNNFKGNAGHDLLEDSQMSHAASHHASQTASTRRRKRPTMMVRISG
jgi:hypothetical protein